MWAFNGEISKASLIKKKRKLTGSLCFRQNCFLFFQTEDKHVSLRNAMPLFCMSKMFLCITERREEEAGSTEASMRWGVESRVAWEDTVGCLQTSRLPQARAGQLCAEATPVPREGGLQGAGALVCAGGTCWQLSDAWF